MREQLIYSSDDGGYYWQRYNPRRRDYESSQVFSTRHEANTARRAWSLEWKTAREWREIAALLEVK